jgi:hypothetical protein
MPRTDLDRIDERLAERQRAGWICLERTDHPPTALIRFDNQTLPTPRHLGAGMTTQHYTARYTCRRIQLGASGDAELVSVPCPGGL